MRTISSDTHRFCYGGVKLLTLLLLSGVPLTLRSATTLSMAIQVPRGFSMIANQLNNGDNSLGTVLRSPGANGVIEGTAIYKFDPAQQSFSVSVFESGVWSNPGLTLAPGEGAFIFNPTNLPIILSLEGIITESTNQVYLTNQVPAGLSIRSSVLPFSGQLDTTLSFPVAEGDIIYRFNHTNGTYLVYTYDFGSWTAPPKANRGESFFVWKAAPATWVQSYTAPPP